MSWQKGIILNLNEQVLHSWDGNCERHHKTLIPQKGLVMTKYVTKEAKETHCGTLVLTNQRLLWFEIRCFLSKAQRASFEIDLRQLKGVACGGTINKWVSITDDEAEYIFHLNRVGKNEIEPFRDMILRQVEKLKTGNFSETPSPPPPPSIVIGSSPIQKEIITMEIVMIPCEYCNGLAPQTSVYCPTCGAQRKK